MGRPDYDAFTKLRLPAVACRLVGTLHYLIQQMTTETNSGIRNRSYAILNSVYKIHCRPMHAFLCMYITV